MDQAGRSRIPAHLWIVAILSTFWNAFGAYDYLMTRTRNMDYLSSMPGVDAQAMLAYIDGFPMWAQIGWGLGVWGGVLGSLLLFARSRVAVYAFAVSLFGMGLSFGYMVAGPAAPAGTDVGMLALMPYFILAVGVALLAYALAMVKRGVLR